MAATIPVSSPGILLENVGTLSTEFCFFDNVWNGNATAIPDFNDPQVCVTLPPTTGQRFVPLNASFAGRVQRGKHLPATWVEVQLAASNDGKAHGDVSIEQGCDGPATVQSIDRTGTIGGFTKEIVSLAPVEATTRRMSDGQIVLQSTIGNWKVSASDPAVLAAAAFAKTVIEPATTYIQGGTGVEDVASSDQAMVVTFY
jgi:hypothetical protein